MEQLACSLLTSYADLLATKRARMESIHSSTEVVRTISENMTVSFIERCVLPHPLISSISEALKDLNPNTPLELGKLLPSD